MFTSSALFSETKTSILDGTCPCGVRPEFHFFTQGAAASGTGTAAVNLFRFPNTSWEPMPLLSPLRGLQTSGTAGSRGHGEEVVSPDASYFEKTCHPPNVTLNRFCRQLVKDSRQRMNLTQTDLARKLYISAVDVKALESGQRPVARSIIDVILYTLNIRGIDDTCFECL